jgi:hypothetical protein
MPSSVMLRSVAFVKTDVSDERSASIIRVTRIGDLEATSTLTSNRITPRRGYVPLKRRFLQDPHGVTSHKPAIFKYIFVY